MNDLTHHIRSAQQGDLDAFEQVARHAQPSAQRYAYSILSDHHLAEDVVQESLVEAFKSIGQLQEPEAFNGWFRRIVYKYCDRILRQRHMALVSLESVVEPKSGQTTPERNVELSDLRGKITMLLESLPDAQRKAVELYYFGDRSQKEIGEQVDTSVSNVKNLLRSARNSLRERIQIMLAIQDQKLTSIAPQFLVDELEPACAYYRDKLGFTVDFVYEGFYAGISRDGIVIHLKCAPKTEIDRQHRRDNEHLDAHVAVENVDGLYAELVESGATITKKLEQRPWDSKDFYVEDPDGYIICFSELTV